MDINGEIRAEMARQQASATQLATWLGVSQSTTTRLLTGKRQFTVDELAATCSRLGVPVWELMKRAEERETAPTAA